MKANIFLTLISIAISCLTGYTAFVIAAGQENDIICGIVTTICFVATLVPMIGIQYESERIAVNIRVLCTLFIISFIISNFSFALFGVKMPYYIMVNGLILLIFLAIFYKFQKLNNL